MNTREREVWMERMLSECVPGGSSCDPQRVADAIREWFAKNDALLAEGSASSEYPECSGDPACCPENEGYGCCKPNPSSSARVLDHAAMDEELASLGTRTDPPGGWRPSASSEGAEAVDSAFNRPMFGRMIEADFEQSTATFEMEPGYYAAAGRFEIRRPQPAQGEPATVDALAQFIREIDGKHELGAGALAEKIVERFSLQQGEHEQRSCEGSNYPEAQQARSWLAVVSVLNEVAPGWQYATSGTGCEKACAAIRALTQRCEGSERRPQRNPAFVGEWHAKAIALGYDGVADMLESVARGEPPQHVAKVLADAACSPERRPIADEVVERACKAAFEAPRANIDDQRTWEEYAKEWPDMASEIRSAQRAALESALPRGVPVVPNGDDGHEHAHRLGVLVYGIDFGDEGMGYYVRLRDFKQVCERGLPAGSDAELPLENLMASVAAQYPIAAIVRAIDLAAPGFAASYTRLATPAASAEQDARDAARYRWLRESHTEKLFGRLFSGSFAAECAKDCREEWLDREIDAAISAQQRQGGAK